MPRNVFDGRSWASRHPILGTEYHYTWQEAMDVANLAIYMFNGTVKV